MEREIKFRGKRIDGADWVYGFYYEKALPLQCIKTPNDKEEEPKGFIIYPGFADWNMPRPMYEVEVVPKTVGQFTGLKDKNGKEVYEGDIVKEQRRRFKDKYFAVKWNNDIGSYIFEPLDKSLTSYPCFNIGTVKGLEVIGNIYENPELLEE